jgi:hypothetical protein
MCGLLIAGGPLLLFAAYGVHGGMPWDYSLVQISEANPGLNGFLYQGDNLRIFTNVSYHLGYLISRLIGLDGSFVGYHMVYAILWLARGALVYAICAELKLGQRVALAAAAISVFHGADLSIGHVGQLQQFANVVWALFAIWLFTIFLTRHSWSALLGSTAFGVLATWSYEGCLIGLLIAPFLLALLLRRLRAAWPGAVIAIAPQIVYAFLLADRLVLHRLGISYQEAVQRHDFNGVISEAAYLFSSLFNPPEWIASKVAYLMSLDFIYSSMALFGAALVALTAGQICFAQGGRSSERRLIEATLVFVVLAAAFQAPFVALDPRQAGLWRTEILPSPFAAMAFAAVIEFIADRLTEKAARLFWATILLFFLGCGLMANAMSYKYWNEAWERIRAPITRMLTAVPNLKPDTVLIVQDVPATFQDWGSNFWFDILCKLAYPRVPISGSYTFAWPADPADIAGVEASGATVMRIGDHQVLVQHGTAFGIEGDKVKVMREYMRPTVQAADLTQVVVLRWTKSGTFQVVTDPKEIEMAVDAAPGYDPQTRIVSPISPVSQRRFALP